MNVCVYLQKEQQSKKKKNYACTILINSSKMTSTKEKNPSKVKNSILKFFPHIKRDGGKSLFQCVIFYAFVVVSFDQYTMTRRGRSEIRVNDRDNSAGRSVRLVKVEGGG